VHVEHTYIAQKKQHSKRNEHNGSYGRLRLRISNRLIYHRSRAAWGSHIYRWN
jgi:hypothetical protein